MYEAQSISIPPKLRWFVRRTDDVYVPLIAVDELPPDIELIGAPRVMEQDMIEGLKFVGAVEHSGKFFSFRRTSECSRDQYQRNDKGHTSSKAASSNPRKSEPGEERPSILTEHSHHEQFCKLSPQIIPQETLSITYINHPQDSPSKDLRPVTASRTVPTPSLVHSKESTCISSTLPSQGQSDAHYAIPLRSTVPANSAPALPGRERYPTDVSPIKPPPSGKYPNDKKKEYCTYWLQRGECNFMGVGCLYKHEMPDKAKLESLGFRTIPLWYVIEQKKKASARRANGVHTGLTWAERQRQAIHAKSSIASKQLEMNSEPSRTTRKAMDIDSSSSESESESSIASGSHGDAVGDLIDIECLELQRASTSGLQSALLQTHRESPTENRIFVPAEIVSVDGQGLAVRSQRPQSVQSSHTSPAPGSPLSDKKECQKSNSSFKSRNPRPPRPVRPHIPLTHLVNEGQDLMSSIHSPQRSKDIAEVVIPPSSPSLSPIPQATKGRRSKRRNKVSENPDEVNIAVRAPRKDNRAQHPRVNMRFDPPKLSENKQFSEHVVAQAPRMGLCKNKIVWQNLKQATSLLDTD